MSCLTKIYCLLALATMAFAPCAFAARARSVRLEGVPTAINQQVRKAYPSAFENGASLSEIDEIVRFMMRTGSFSYVEATERGTERGSERAREVVVQAVLLRRVAAVRVTGNERFSTSDVVRKLGVSVGDPFERKNLQTAADQITKDYGEAGYVNAKAEIVFETPNEKDVNVVVAIAEGQPCRIVDVIFDLSNPDLKAKLLKMTKSLLREPLSSEAVYGFQTKMNEWFQSNRYLTAKLSSPSVSLDEKREKAKLTWQLENPYRWDFIFEGNAYYGDGAIVRAMELDKLFGVAASPAIDLAERARRKYFDTGFAHASVDYEEKTFDDLFKKQIRFKIHEGPRVRIKRVEIAGSISRPESYYAGFIRANSSELVTGNFYNRADIEKGYKNLIVELQNQGFLRAKVPSMRVEFSKDKEYATIGIQLDEGPLTQLRQIKFDGASAFSKTQLSDVLTIKSNAPLSLQALETSLQLLKNFYQSAGYLEMKVLNENEPETLVVYNDSNTQANVEIRVLEGPKVIVGTIVPQGNTFTLPEVITRELAFQKGDVLTPEKIEESTIRLQRMALFSRVNIRTLEENQNISERTVLIEVEERDPGLLSSGAGITNERLLTYRGFVGFAYRNLGGTGRAITSRLDLKYSSDPDISFLENKLSAGYVEPYILGGRNRGRINLTRKQEYWLKEIVSPQHVEIRDSNIAEFLIERDLTRHLKLIFTAWHFQNDKIFDRVTYNTLVTQNIGKFGPFLEYDLRDDTFNPTRGTHSFASFEYANPAIGSSDDAKQLINFIKFNAGSTLYSRISSSPKWIWANAVRSGYVANVSNEARSGVPAIESFFLGGRSSIRGYDTTDPNQLIPNYRQLGIAGNTEGINAFAVGVDSWYYLVKTELRFPIYGAIGGAIFYDGGAVYVNQSVNAFHNQVDTGDPYRHSIGVALRIATPVGPVNVEAGFKLNRRELPDQTFEAPAAFHFSIGTF